MIQKDYLSRSCFYQLRQLKVICSSLFMSAANSLVHAFVASRLDYCNSLYSGLPKNLLHALQSILNAAARLVARAPRYSTISDFMLKTLHWLPISDRIDFKLITLTSAALRGQAPSYLTELFSPPSSSNSHHQLRSCTRNDLLVPRSRTTFAQRRSFRVTGPSLWNGLPPSTRAVLLTPSPSSLKKLKSHFLAKRLSCRERL